MTQSKRNILFLSIPGSVHDQKWMSPVALDPQTSCYFIGVDHQRPLVNFTTKDWLNQNQITLLGTLAPFSIRHLFRTIQQLWWLRRVIVRHHIHQIHIFYAEPHALWALVALIHKIPISLTTRGTDVLRGLKTTFESKMPFNRWLVAPLYRLAFRKIKAITATSQRQQAGLKEIGVSAPISIIRTGVDLAWLSSFTSQKHPKSPNLPYVFFPRLMKPLYNHEFALSALAKLAPEIRSKYAWVFINSDTQNTSYLNRIQSLMNHAGDNIFWLPQQTQAEMMQLYAQASAVVMTPLSDGSPVSAMEAMAFGKPLILGPLPYDDDLFHPSWVYRLNSWDYDEFNSLLEEALTLDTKSEKALEIVQVKGSWEEQMEQFKQLLINLHTPR